MSSEATRRIAERTAQVTLTGPFASVATRAHVLEAARIQHRDERARGLCHTAFDSKLAMQIIDAAFTGAGQ